MGELIHTLRAIVREELAQQRAPDLGIVTEVFPGDGADGRHAVSARLRDTGLEILRAPVAVARPGVSLLPRVGDLVVVAFMGGDLMRPVVLGSIYHADQLPPEAAPLDHLYQPDDEADDAVLRVALRTPGGGEITVTDAALTVSMGGTEVIVNDGGDVEIKSQGNVKIESAADITIKASGGITLEATGALSLKGATAKLEGSGSADVKAPAISIAGMTQLKAG